VTICDHCGQEIAQDAVAATVLENGTRRRCRLHQACLELVVTDGIPAGHLLIVPRRLPGESDEELGRRSVLVTEIGGK
jgi:hypothetical protein